MLGRKNDLAIVVVQMMLWHLGENDRFVSEGDGGRTRDPRTALEIRDLMFWKLGAGAYQAHIPDEHIQQLGQLIEFPPAQKRANWSKPLVLCCRDSMMCSVHGVRHGSELQDGESATVTPRPLLQK